jgi:hypothetical protein
VTTIIILVAYIFAVVSTVYFWDEERRRDFYKAFMPKWQLEMNMVLFPFLSPIMLLFAGVMIRVLFSQ